MKRAAFHAALLAALLCPARVVAQPETCADRLARGAVRACPEVGPDGTVVQGVDSVGGEIDQEVVTPNPFANGNANVESNGNRIQGEIRNIRGQDGTPHAEPAPPTRGRDVANYTAEMANRTFQNSRQPPPAGDPGGPPPPEGRIPRTLVDEAVRANPTGGWENQAAAINRAAEGEHEDALPYFRAAIENGREEPRLLTWAALSAYNAGDMEQASEWAHRARMLDPKGPLSAQAGAIEKMALNRLSDAKTGKEQTPGEAKTPGAGERHPPLPEPAFTPDPPRPKDAAALAPSALELANRYAAEARAAVKVGDNAKAVERATRALEQDPDDARALNLRAAAFARMNRYEEARQDAQRGLDLAAGYIPLLLTRGLAAGRTGKTAEAKASALEVLRKDARNPAALRLLAFAQAADRDRAGMLATLRKAAPNDPAAAQVLSRALTMPDEADATVLFSDAVLFGEAAAPAAPAPKRGLPKLLLVVGASLLAGLIAGGVILLAGRDRDGTAAWTPRPAPAPSEESVGPYRILGTLGAGGMGVVYKAEDPALERTLALKRMRDEIAEDPRERERFLQEARIVSKLDHPGIVRIFSIYEGGEGTYLVFELVEGKTLSEILGERGALPFAEARGILAQACEAVAYAHGKFVVHRDLKPSNIMQDATGRVRVMDFGIARAAKEALTRLTAQGTVAGTPGYMAPEQEEGRCSPASDVYALGVCFYEMLAGRTPFAGSGIALYQAKRAGKFPPLQLPGHPEVDAVLAKALHPDPAQRYASPKDLAAALNAVPA